MTRCFRNRLATALAVLAFASLAGTWSVEAARDRQEVARMTQKMKTVCIGRLLIDLPEEAEVHLSRPRIDGFDIKVRSESFDEFQQRLASRESSLRSKPDLHGGHRNLELGSDVRNDAGLVGKIFVHSRKVSEGRAANGLKVETYRYEGVAVESLVHGQGLSFEVSADYYDPALIQNLSKLVAKLVPNPGNAVPSEPGYCIDRALIRDPLTADQGEEIMMSAALPSRPDVEFKMILAAGLVPAEQRLIERSEANALSSIVPVGRVSRVRAVQRTIAGLEGDELVRRYVEDNDAVVYSFWWEVPGTEDDVLVPHIVFMMDTGTSETGPIPSSLSEGAALGLWDTVMTSIRFRPSAQPRRVEEVPVVPIGTYASAGDVCPQSGWWLCSDGGNGTHVLGGQRQYIAKGERMPQALLLPQQTWWERLRGLQPSYESKNPTAWKLEDKRSRKRIVPVVQLAAPTPAPLTSTLAVANSAGEVPHSPAPLGSYASTGAPCPASGWWRSEEPHALDGTRWFAEGSLLPPATFVVPGEVFGRGGGAAKAIRRRGAWQLVRHAEAEHAHLKLSSQDDPPLHSNGPSER